jgi:hypothetical protein
LTIRERPISATLRQNSSAIDKSYRIRETSETANRRISSILGQRDDARRVLVGPCQLYPVLFHNEHAGPEHLHHWSPNSFRWSSAVSETARTQCLERNHGDNGNRPASVDRNYRIHDSPFANLPTRSPSWRPSLIERPPWPQVQACVSAQAL